MTIQVPSQYQSDVANAAKALGIPPEVVAAQIDLESGWNPNAVSQTGAQGIAQFEPGTWHDYGTGSPFNPSDAFAAYVSYMRTLLNQEKGDVRKALEAYNAGPGNLSAGSGYADTILSRAGVDSNLLQTSTTPYDRTSGTGSNSGGGWTSGLGTVFNDVTGGLFTWPGQIIGTLSDLDQMFTNAYHGLALFFKPSTYVRIGAGLFGFIFIILGIVCLARETKGA